MFNSEFDTILAKLDAASHAWFEINREEEQKRCCIMLSYAEAEEAYNALKGMRKKCTALRKHAEKYKDDDSFNLYDHFTFRLETMNKLIARLEKKLATR